MIVVDYLDALKTILGDLWHCRTQIEDSAATDWSWGIRLLLCRPLVVSDICQHPPLQCRRLGSRRVVVVHHNS